ncbi:phytanoyl-CoA dioxygenase family protein [Micromonospora craniellae]|uniref:phytanoyl-CoA dioxygenase family protein n=1 Tax=Micromonospora craniellae TaxID=2294034 RepID=UPI0013141661|nr:phytanoyl-CoA dioxygenase family protein [Micromonospora craniellae]QOC93912.1 phytanoyl-CoA dioxygenase family protein [Micromonospora craniellae]
MTPDALAQFERDGYVVFPELFAPAEIVIIRDAIPRVLDENRSILGLPGPERVRDSNRLLDQVLCVHHVHKISEIFRSLAEHPSILRHLVELVGPQVKCLQSQLFVKPPGFPGNPWHQDEGPIPTRDRSLVAVWIALDDATAENGCLKVVPGSHRSGYLYPVREHHRPDEYDFTTESYGFDEERARTVEMAAGSAIFFHGYLLHGSSRNESLGKRRALTYHYMNSFSLLPWQGGRGDYRDVFPVLGADPYEWKGYEEQSVPHLRMWPDPGRAPGVGALPYALRTKITAAVRLWGHDERAALRQLREALRETPDDL